MKQILLILAIIIFQINIQAQEKSVALVIGNAKYKHGNSLRNPVNDAELMARTLKALNFTVIKKINATRTQMTDAIIEFSKKVKDYDVALFYYAGHGIQIDGINYLIPVDAKIEDPVAVKFEALDVGNIVSQFEYYTNHANIVVLDACRENPFLTWVRGSMNSFAPVKAPRGTFIAFSTGSGSVAYDGVGTSNGLYTGVLADELLNEQRIEDVFINTRNKVYEISNGKQQPQEWSQLSGSFYFTRSNIEKSNIAFNKKTELKNDCSRTHTKNISVNNEFENDQMGTFTDQFDKKEYKWVKIGNQIWMAENLDRLIDTTKSFYYDHNKAKYGKLGRLYTWEGAQNACPVGWHLPSNEEWVTMILNLGRDKQVAHQLKSTISHEESKFYWAWSEKAKEPTNSSGFNALHSGCSNESGFFHFSYNSTNFWTTTEYKNNKTSAFAVAIPSTFNKVYSRPMLKGYGFSVRCLKD